MRAVTPVHRYIMKRPESGWDKKFFDRQVRPAYTKHRGDVLAEMKESIISGKQSPEEATSKVSHEIWLRVSRELNLDYIQEIL
jgi:hypothetical protein